MAPTRPLPIRSLLRSAPSRSARTTNPQASSRQWQRTSRRGYASESGSEGGSQGKAGQSRLTAELPWIIPAVTVTVGGTYFVAKDAHFGPLWNHPMPGQDYHGHDEHEEGEGDEEGGDEEGGKGEEGEGEGDGGAEEGGEQEQSDQGGEDQAQAQQSSSGGDDSQESSGGGDDQPSDDSEGDSSSSSSSSSATQSSASSQAVDDKKTKGQTHGKNFNEVSADGTLKRKDVKSTENSKGGPPRADETHELESSDGRRKLHIPDAKGGARLRLESPRGDKQGLLEEEEEKGSDVAAASKKPVRGGISGKQAGLSNTDTKHPSENLKGGSTKAEGLPETAKVQGTVDPSRPAK